MTRFRHSRERGNPGKSIPPRRETPAFAGVTALETFYEAIKFDLHAFILLMNVLNFGPISPISNFQFQVSSRERLLYFFTGS